MRRSLLSFAVIAAVFAGCTTEAPDANPTPHDMKAGPGLFSGESGNMLDSFKAGNGGLLTQDGTFGVAAMAGNMKLWQAALDVTSILPLAQTDSTGGVIITEWAHVPNSKPAAQVKANIIITGTALAEDSFKVNVFKRMETGGGWSTSETDAAAAAKLKKAILTKARLKSK